MSYEFIDMKIGHHLLALPLYIFWSMVMQKKIQPVLYQSKLSVCIVYVLPILTMYHILASKRLPARYDSSVSADTPCHAQRVPGTQRDT